MTPTEQRHAREQIIDRLLDAIALVDFVQPEHLEAVGLAVDALTTRLEEQMTR